MTVYTYIYLAKCVSCLLGNVVFVLSEVKLRLGVHEMQADRLAGLCMEIEMNRLNERMQYYYSFPK
jgi:hypothetical protein